MKIKIKKIESHYCEGGEESSWSTERTIIPTLGIVKEAPVFEITEIGADYIRFSAAENQMLSLGIHSDWPEDLAEINRPVTYLLQADSGSICISRGVTYNGSDYRTRFIISLTD